MKEIEVKIIDGKTCVRAKDLKPNPTNENIYDQSAMKDIGQSMMKRKQKGLIPNIQPVTYWPCGMIDVGHTRTGAAVENDIEYIWAVPSDAPPPDSSAPYDEITHTLDGNIVRKKVWSVLLGEYQAMKTAYKEQYGLDMPNVERDAVLKRIGLTKKYCRYLEEIRHFEPELMQVVDNGGSVEHTWKLATGQLGANVTPAKKNGMNLASLFSDTRVQSKLVGKAIKYAQDIRDLSMKFEDFEISPFGNNECGKWESGAFTGILSHTFMSVAAGCLKEMGYNVRTASGHKDDPDIYFIDDDEKIEVKCTQFNGHGAATKWSGGKNVREGKYILVAHDVDFENIFVAFSSLDVNDWGNPDINNKKTMKLSDWYTNHKDDKDLQIWKGNVQIIKTNKIKEGQVQMSLSPVNEPI
tara:strand:+ start:299 stop:1528 length:1230 start_codon:yes stop_codon:yes gene_type:complete